MKNISSAQYPHHSNHHPKDIEHRVRLVLSDDGAPRKEQRISSVDNPNEHEWALGTEPADQAKAENSHQHADHLEVANLLKNENIQRRQAHQATLRSRHQ